MKVAASVLWGTLEVWCQTYGFSPQMCWLYAKARWGRL